MILKGFLQWKLLKSEDVKLLKSAIDSRAEMAKELEVFITNMMKSQDFGKNPANFKESFKLLPLRV